MAEIHGRFIWHELLTADAAAAIAFYPRLTSWAVTDMPVAEKTYQIFRSEIAPVAALVDTATEPPGVPGESWISYFGVEDIEGAIADVARLGGSVLLPTVDAPQIGFFAIVADPHGAPFGLFTPTPSNPGRDQLGAGAAGHVGWHELYTPEPEASFEFYAELFGWNRGPRLEMGPAGFYQIIVIGGQSAGGIMRKPDFIEQPCWNPFVRVSDITSVERLLLSTGATVIDPLREIPDGDWTLKCSDPHGAIFALVGRRSD